MRDLGLSAVGVLITVVVVMLVLMPMVYADPTLPYRPLMAGTKIMIYKETWGGGYWWRGQGSIGIPVYKTVYVDHFRYCVYGFVTAGGQGDVGDRVYQPDVGAWWNPWREQWFVGRVYYVAPQGGYAYVLVVKVETRSAGETPQTISTRVYSNHTDYNAAYYDTIIGYKYSNQAYRGEPIHKVGMTTWETVGYIVDISLIHDPFYGYVLPFSATAEVFWDMGGIVYKVVGGTSYAKQVKAYGVFIGRVFWNGGLYPAFNPTDYIIYATGFWPYTGGSC